MDRIKKFEPIFGEWYAESFIGAGSFGRVYKIYREELGNRFYSALKYISLPAENDEIRQLRFDGMDDASISTYYTDLAKDISSEITLMNKLRGNSNIVSFEDSKIIPKPNGMGYDIFIRMELLESLTNRASESAAAPEEAVKIGADICNALVRCQKNNIIHRDIKPDNIFVSEDGDYKLGDFGVARKLEKAATFMSKKGTYNYMAPEVYKGERYGATCDIYSLGLVMYRMLNRGRLPFLPPAPAPILTSDREQALLRRMSGEALPAPCDADPELARIILKACEYEPAKRYSAAADMRRELINYSAGMSSAPKAQRDNDPYEATGGAYTHAPARQNINTDNYESTGGTFSPAPAQQQPEVNYDATSGVFGAAAAAEAVRHEAPDLDATSGVFSAPAKSEKAPEPEKHSFDPDATQSITTYKDRQKKAEPVKEEKKEKPAEPVKAPEPAPVKAEAKPEKPAGKKTGLIVGLAAAALALVVGILAIAGVFGGKKDTGEQVAENTQGAATVTEDAGQQTDRPEATAIPEATAVPGATNSPADGETVTFKDKRFNDLYKSSFVRNPNDPIMLSDVLAKTELLWYERGLSDISDIAYFKNLTTLWLSKNNISDISALSGLTKLTELSLDKNNISNISALSGLTNLTELSLGDNNISDITPLKELSALQMLIINNNNISDISVLRNLNAVDFLYVYGNNISDISALSGLTNLETLSLSDNKISDISALSGLTNLTWLDLRNNDISDISVLAGLEKLEYLDLSNNPLTQDQIDWLRNKLPNCEYLFW